MIRIGALLAAACLFVALLALGSEVSYGMFGPLLTGQALALPGSCGGESAPAPAVAAGFTTCVSNSDFTAATGTSWQPSQYAFSGQVSTVSNWLDCAGTDSTKPWHTEASQTQTPIPCSVMGIVSDPVAGINALDVPWRQSYGTAYAPSTSYVGRVGIVTMANGYNGPPTPDFPNSMYIEETSRLSFNSGNQSTAETLGGVWAWERPPSACIMETDFAEMRTGVTGGTGWNGLLGDSQTFVWGCNGQSGGTVTSNSCFYIAPQFGSSGCPTTPGDNVVVTQYNKYGFLVTSDGANQIYTCQFVNDTLSTCYAAAPGNGSSGWSLLYTNRRFLYIDNEPYPGPGGWGNPYPGDSDIWTQYVRVWSCANWATTECNGSTLVNGPPPTLTYYH